MRLACAAALACSGPAAAQDELLVDVAECITLESPVERFACYESRVDAALTGGSERPAAERETRGPAAGIVSRGRQQSTAPGTDARRRDEQPARGRTEREAERAEDAAEDREILGTVSQVEELFANRVLITLDDGQVWRQMNSETYPLKAGHRVRIYPTRWGRSYRLSAEELRGFIQVERVR